MQTTIKQLQHLLADTYTLYLKTQNYHWHVKGPNFTTLHKLFEEQYQALAELVDSIAERIIILGAKAPATYKEFAGLTKIAEGNSSLTAEKMIAELAADQKQILTDLHGIITSAQKENDEGTVSLASEAIAKYEKTKWILENHLS